ncbi:MAG TPA: ABC transporter substrate-binding protein, partial [Actinomycetota bacterium]|nr:ABC transporter substrate-binding protein [Actinomycetota bacterium]
APATTAPVEPADVTVFLGFTPDGLYAPVYVAKELGYFDDEKLNVTIAPGTGSNSAVKVVGAGRAQFGFADALSMSHGVAGGAPLKMVAVELREPPAATVVLKTSGIKTIKDLNGKTIGDSEDSAQVPILPCLLQANGLTMNDINFVNLGFPEQVPALLSGKVDALEGYGYFYGNLADKVDLLPWSQYGLDYYSEGIFVNTDYLDQNPDVVKRFLAAFVKGFKYELDNPDQAAHLLAQGSNSLKSEDFFNYEIHTLAPMLVDSDEQANGLGHMAADKWQSTVDTLKCGGVANPPSPDSLYSNDYLPNPPVKP